MTKPSTVQKTIDFPAIGCSIGNVEVTPLGDNKYRLEEAVPLSECTAIYDVIRAKRIDDATIQFVRVTEHSNWKTYSYGIPKEHADSAVLDAAIARIESQGALWDQVFGGLLFVYVSPDSDYVPDADVAEVVN